MCMARGDGNCARIIPAALIHMSRLQSMNLAMFRFISASTASKADVTMGISRTSSRAIRDIADITAGTISVTAGGSEEDITTLTAIDTIPTTGGISFTGIQMATGIADRICSMN